jgi:hypothetical protein
MMFLPDPERSHFVALPIVQSDLIYLIFLGVAVSLEVYLIGAVDQQNFPFCGVKVCFKCSTQ